MADFTTMLEGLTLQTSIGIHAEELAARQRLLISVWLHCRYDDDDLPDDISAVVDYDFLRREIIALVAGRHFNLQESLCEEIARLALVDPRVRHVRVRTAKPDIYPDATISCEIERANGSL